MPVRGKNKNKRKSEKKVGGTGFYPVIKTTRKAYQKGAVSKSKTKVKPVGWKKPKAKKSPTRSVSRKRG